MLYLDDMDYYCSLCVICETKDLQLGIENGYSVIRAYLLGMSITSYWNEDLKILEAT